MCSYLCKNLPVVMYRKFRIVPIFKDIPPICPYFLGFRVGKYVSVLITNVDNIWKYNSTRSAILSLFVCFCLSLVFSIMNSLVIVLFLSGMVAMIMLRSAILSLFVCFCLCLVFSIMNSLVIVLFLSGMVAMIMLRTLHKDISRYNQQDLVSRCVGW